MARWDKGAAVADDYDDNTGTPSHALGLGQVISGVIDSATDQDWFALTLTAGHTYHINLIGYSDAGGGLDDPYLELRNSLSQLLTSDDDSGAGRNSSITFTATATGTFYIAASSYQPDGSTGAYHLAIFEDDGTGNLPAGFEPAPPVTTPLTAIDWVNYTAPATIKVFFSEEGATINDGGGSFVASGWNSAETAAALAAFANYEAVANVHFEVTTDIAQADFILAQNPNTPNTDIVGNLGYWDIGGGDLYYNDPNRDHPYQVDGIGVFNSKDGSWTDASLAVGGYGYITLIHEIGHGMGMAHPHDHGGGSDVMHGVTSAFGDYGDYGLDQGVFTTMSYNDGWATAPQVSPRARSAGNYGFGWQGTLMALDIAELQLKYGANTTAHTGSDTYALSGTNAPGTCYQAIWDAGGTDAISYSGSRDAHISLRAATLDYSSSGGGVVSWVKGIYGGFTIANGVLIENATGGSGNDWLQGNTAHNVLDGGLGIDAVDYSYTSRAITLALNSAGTVFAYVGGVSEDTLVSIENATGGSGADALTGDGAANQLAGGNGNDMLSGGGGNDTLTGGGGKDRLTGGAGYDQFVFNSKLSASTNVDTITDFRHNADQLALDNAVMSAVGAAGALPNYEFYVHSGATHGHDSNDRVVYDSSSGKLYYDSNGSASGGVTQIALLVGHPVLDAGDFLIV